jgi:hypothetical protein
MMARPSQKLTGVVFAVGDHQSRRFRGSQVDLLALLERGQQGEPSGGGAVTKWSPEHRQRCLPTAVYGGKLGIDAISGYRMQMRAR